MIRDNRIEFAKFMLNYVEAPVNPDDVDWEEMNRLFEINNIEYLETLRVRNKPELMHINWIVSNYYGLNALVVRHGKSRKRDVTEPRQVAHYIAVKIFKYTYREVAEFYSRTHATIIFSVKTVQNQMDTDKSFKSDIHTLIEKFNYEKNKTGSPI